MSGIVLDRTGATSTGLRAAEEMQKVWSASDFENSAEGQPGPAAVVQVDDRFVATGTADNLSFSVWIEGDSDVFVQFFPKHRTMKFPFECQKFAQGSDAIAAEVLITAMGRQARAVADYFTAEMKHLREAVGARAATGDKHSKHKGMDLMQITVLDMFRLLNTKSLSTGNSRWAEVVRDLIQRHDRLAGTLAQSVGK